ncbi:hypothetical protein KBZ21_55975, partial [Streptomyces sp. A73]|nr:hypothetical protein [Streptomyces sp. A73]
HLAAAIEAGGTKRPAITKKWRTDTRLLLDKDGITPDQAIAAIKGGLPTLFKTLEMGDEEITDLVVAA